MARLLKKSEMAGDPIGEYLFDKMLYSSFVKKSKDNLMYKKALEDDSEDKVYKWKCNKKNNKNLVFISIFIDILD